MDTGQGQRDQGVQIQRSEQLSFPLVKQMEQQGLASVQQMEQQALPLRRLRLVLAPLAGHRVLAVAAVTLGGAAGAQEGTHRRALVRGRGRTLATAPAGALETSWLCISLRTFVLC